MSTQSHEPRQGAGRAALQKCMFSDESDSVLFSPFLTTLFSITLMPSLSLLSFQNIVLFFKCLYTYYGALQPSKKIQASLNDREREQEIEKLDILWWKRQPEAMSVQSLSAGINLMIWF